MHVSHATRKLAYQVSPRFGELHGFSRCATQTVQLGLRQLEATPTVASLISQMIRFLWLASTGSWRGAVVALVRFIPRLALRVVDIARACIIEAWSPRWHFDASRRQTAMRAQQQLREGLGFEPERWICRTRDNVLAWLARQLEALDARLQQDLARVETAKQDAQVRSRQAAISTTSRETLQLTRSRVR